jgi:hypothetical protein
MGNAIGTTTADTPHHHHGVIKKRLLRWENSGFSQRINNSNDGGAAELRTTNNNYNNNNNNSNAGDESTQRKIQQLESQLHTDTNNLKLYSIFGALLTFIGFILSILGPVMSCSFGIITWSDDNNDSNNAMSPNNNDDNNNNPAYQSTITNVGLFTWYNPNTSTCWSYSPLDTQYFYVDGTARGMAIASLFFGGCALLWILGRLVSIFILGRSDVDSDSNNNNNNNNNNGSIKLRTRTTFLTLAGLTFLASITQISTLTYFLTKKNEGNDNYIITCNNYTVNGKKEGNCSKGIGAHDAIIAFLFYLLAFVVYTIAGVKCCTIQVNNDKSKRSRFHKRGGGKGGKKKGGEDDDEELYKSTIDVHKCTSASCNCNNGGLENVSFIPVVAASSKSIKSGDELTRQAKMAAATTTGGVVGSATIATTNTVNKEYEYWYPEASRISDEGSDI